VLREGFLKLHVLKKPLNDHSARKRVSLADHGVTFERYKAELEKGIVYGYKPHFGYPMLAFNDIPDGFKALNYEDEAGYPDPIMSVVNQDSIEKFQNLLVSTHNAKINGDTLVVEKQPKSKYDRCWLYNFI